MLAIIIRVSSTVSFPCDLFMTIVYAYHLSNYTLTLLLGSRASDVVTKRHLESSALHALAQASHPSFLHLRRHVSVYDNQLTILRYPHWHE
jgi:hypothetical protein